jgi:diguanylate cyclase (GGDEF)-like protein/PAS domain S-box-containing protein
MLVRERAMKLLLAPRLALALTWGFSMVVIVVLVVSTNMIRRQHHDDGAKAAQGYARLSTEHVTGSLQTIDLTLQIISEHLASRQRWPGNLAGDSKTDEREAIVSIMSSYSSRLLGAIGMIVADPDGNVVVATGPDAPASITSKRFIDELRTAAPSETSISEAFRDNGSGPLKMLVAKTLRGPDAAYKGSVSVIIDLEQQFNRFYSDLELPQESTVSLYSRDNRLLSRFPQLEDQIGNQPKTPQVAILLNEQAQHGVAFALSEVDQRQRVYAVRSIPNYPVRLLVSLADTHYMAFAYTYTRMAIYGGLGTILFSCILSYFAIRKRQATDEANALVKSAQDSLMANVAVLDRDGVIISVNDGWREFAESNARDAGVAVPNTDIGTNYLNICKGARGECSSEASEVSEGIRAVLEGREPSFQVVYPCHSQSEKRFFQMMVAPLRTAKGGAVVSHTNITRMVLAEEALRETEQHFRTIANSGSALILTAGLDMGCTYFNDAWLRFTGREFERELGNGWTEGVHPEDVTRCMQIYADGFNDRQPFSMDFRLMHVDGTYHWIQNDGAPRYDSHGVFIGFIGNCLDITERKRTETELVKLNQAVEQSPDSILVTDTEGNIEFVNQAFLTVTGYQLVDVLGKNPRLLRSDKTPSSTHDTLWATITQGNVWRGEFINRRRDGGEFIESATVGPVRDLAGNITHYLAVQRDITEQRRVEEEVNRLSYYDPLTGLANRAMMLDRVSRALKLSRQRNHQYALLIIDIDRFKTFNDARGHDHGDMLLVAVARRISEILKGSEILARMSGDEFALLIKDKSLHADSVGRRAMSAAEAIHAALQDPFAFESDDAHVSASIGIALIPEIDEDSTQDILRRADTALHRAKEAGGNRTAFFEARMGEMVQHRFQVERDLRHGIQDGGLRLYLQPQVSADGVMVGAEALVRWQHPERGLVPPALFIPIAEETDLIADVDVWVLEEVCKLLARKEMADSRIRISVNVSPRHFRQAGFVEWIKQVLLIYGADPCRLTLEVTEGLVIDNVSDVIAKMNVLAEMGFHFSLDDFGTGYSSLAYLKRLPIHELKIDKSFVQDVTTNVNDGRLVETILSVAGHMGLKVVAEGVETQEQATFLNDRAIVVHQGFLYGRPEPVEQWLLRCHPPKTGSQTS